LYFFLLLVFCLLHSDRYIKIGGKFVYGIAVTGLVSHYDGTVAENKKEIPDPSPENRRVKKKLGIPLMAAGRRNTSKRAVLAVEFVLRIHLIGKNVV